MTSESAFTELLRHQGTGKDAVPDRQSRMSSGVALLAVGAAFLLADHLQEAHTRVDRAAFDQAAAEVAARSHVQQAAMVVNPVATVVLVCKDTAPPAHDPQKIAAALAARNCLAVPAPQVSGFGFPPNYYTPKPGAYGLRTPL